MSHACPGDAQHLDEGGFALIQCDWIVRSGDDPCAAPLAWAEGTGYDLVLLDQGAEDGLSYATRWNARARDTSLAEFEAGVERWVSYYRGIGAQSIGSGTLVLRRRTAGANWQRTFPLATWPAGAAGEHVRRLFEAQDLLAAVDGSELLDLALRPVEGFRLDQRLRYRDGKYHQPPAQVSAEPGLALDARVAPDLLDLIFELDGHRPLREVLQEDTAVSTMRELFARGFLVAGDSSPRRMRRPTAAISSPVISSCSSPSARATQWRAWSSSSPSATLSSAAWIAPIWVSTSMRSRSSPTMPSTPRTCPSIRRRRCWSWSLVAVYPRGWTVAIGQV